jgi:hypothetical protein
MPDLHFVPWHRGTAGQRVSPRLGGAAAPVTGVAADEYNPNIVDCNASVTVARRSSISVSGGLAQPPEATVKDNDFPWPPPGLPGIFYYFVPT